MKKKLTYLATLSLIMLFAVLSNANALTPGAPKGGDGYIRPTAKKLAFDQKKGKGAYSADSYAKIDDDLIWEFKEDSEREFKKMRKALEQISDELNLDIDF